MDLEKMGKFISELRTEKGLKQSELGELVGVDNKVISKWEKGTNAPDVMMLITLSNIFSVRVEEIVKGERIDKYQEEDLKVQITNTENLVVQEEIIKNRSKNLKNKNYIIVILVFAIAILVILNINTHNKLITDETITIDLINDDTTPLNVNGCIMSSNSSNLYVIKGVSYEKLGDDKTGEVLITEYEIKLLIDNQMIATYTHRFDNSKKLADAVDNLAFSVESSKKFNKNSNIKLQVKYTTIDNDKEITETDLKI